MSILTIVATARNVFAECATIANKLIRRPTLIERISKPRRSNRRWGNLPWERIPFFGQDKRRSQLLMIASDPASVDVQGIESWLNRNLAICAGSLGLAVAGTLLYPPLILLSLPGLLYGSIPIYVAGYRTIFKERRSGVDILYAATHTLVIANRLFVQANLGVCWFFLSLKLLAMAKARFKQNLQDIFVDVPVTVYVLVDGVEVEQPLETLDVEDIVVVHPGETIPVDGVITEGIAAIDEHALTGAFQPVEKAVGDAVFASTVMHTGRILVRVQQSGESTIVAKINQILQNTVEYKSNKRFGAETLTDGSVVPLAVLAGLSLPFIGPNGATALIDAHPHRRMLISTSLSTLNFVSVAAQQGILVKDGRTLELLNKVDTVVFDKTGTLTLDQPHVGQIFPCNGYTEETVLAYAAAAEHRQVHPIAKAILHAAETRQTLLRPIDDARYHVGYGLTVNINEGLVRVGSVRFMQQENISIPPSTAQAIDDAHKQGVSVVLVAVNENLAGMIELHATVRPEVNQIIETFRRRNLSLSIISGDHEAPTRKLADSLGLDQYFAETLPEEKAGLIAQLQAAGKSVCFVGDGINDTVAMKQAHVSVSLRGATTAATDTAHVVLMHENLNQLLPLFDLVEEFQANVRNTMMAILVPAVLSVSGALFLGTGLIHTEIMNQGSFPLSLGTAMLPRLRRRNRQDAPDSTQSCCEK